MPSEWNMALDVGPLLAEERTGIARYAEELLTRLPPAIGVTPYTVGSGRNGDPADVRCTRQLTPPPSARHMRASLARLAWATIHRPSARYWVGAAPQLIHGTNFVVPPSRGLPAVVTVHDLAELHQHGYSGQGPSNLHQLRRARRDGVHFHVPSSAVALDLVEHLHVPEEQISVIHHGTPEVSSQEDDGSGRDNDDPRRTEQERELFSRPYILGIGTLEPRKRFPWLIRVFERACAGNEVNLIIVGSDTLHEAEARATRDAASASSLADHVKIPGYIGDNLKGRLLRGALALAVPSSYEGFSLPILEAFSVGTPVVATRVGGIPEVAGTAAILLDSDSESDMIEALRSIVNDPGLRQELSEKGLDRVRGFSWTEAIRQHVAMYARILA